jgi:hypothetical protein
MKLGVNSLWTGLRGTGLLSPSFDDRPVRTELHPADRAVAAEDAPASRTIAPVEPALMAESR